MNHIEASLIGQDNDPMPAEHTPGPWEARTAPLNPEGWLWVQNGPGALLANVHTNQNIPLEVRNLNARLMSAAPELLSALEALLDAPEWESLDYVSVEFVRAQDAADDAIRKAKGQLT